MATTDAGTNDPPVFNHDAFAARHMPNLGHDVKDFKVFHWKLQGWRKLERKLISPEFDCGGHQWRILLFPFGNYHNAPPNDTVSVYLEHPNPREGSYVCAQFALVISNPHDPSIYTVCYTHHRFTAQQCDWGFIHFSELRKLFHPQPGIDRPTIEGESAVVSVYVRVLGGPTGALWCGIVNYNSRKETGYVGLRNLGATGYMNAVLQSLFHIHYFRKAVYKIPTEGQHPAKSVPLALQRVFFLLQTSDHFVDTVELTKSFGWAALDTLIPHDVQEFNGVLQHELASKMKGTRAEGTITKLFVGKVKSLIKCVNVDYEISMVEEFNDIQLKVKGMRTLYNSFRDYVTVKMLCGEHGYQTGEFGLQDARAAVIFQSLPPVLHLQLKRYEYDVQHDIMVKINDRFEFPFEIDLGEFVDETADRTGSWKYQLHSVFVHSGGIHGGHNYAFIKPDRDTRWLIFDDNRVTPASEREVLGGNYGGEPPSGVIPKTQRDQAMVMKRSRNANVLVYIRETAMDEILAPFTEKDTPLHLGQKLSEERARAEANREERGSSLTAKIVTDGTFSRHGGFDLAAFDKTYSPLSDLPTFRVPKQTTYSAFKSGVAQHFSYPESQIRLRVLVRRQNRTVRPDAPIPENQASLTVGIIRDTMAVREDLWLYLDILPDPSKASQPGSVGTVVLFLKHFDAATQSLSGVGKIDMPRASKMSDLIPVIKERMKWASGTLLSLYEEIKPGMIELMKLDDTLTQSEIQDGDIICFQTQISDQEVHDLESRGLYSTPQRFYEFLRKRVAKPDE